jgi:hypothetical protein
MTPPGSALISAYLHRALAHEANGDFDRAKADFNNALAGAASDAGSKANQATAKVRLSLLSELSSPPASRLRRNELRHRRRRLAQSPAGASRW